MTSPPYGGKASGSLRGGSGGEARAAFAPVDCRTMIESAASSTKYTNCGADSAGVYCARCGEKQPGHHDLSVSHFAHEVFDELAHVDSKLFTILRDLNPFCFTLRTRPVRVNTCVSTSRVDPENGNAAPLCVT